MSEIMLPLHGIDGTKLGSELSMAELVKPLIGRPYLYGADPTWLSNRLNTIGVAAETTDAPSNCQALGHMLLYRATGVELPLHVLSMEMAVSPNVDGPLVEVDVTPTQAVGGELAIADVALLKRASSELMGHRRRLTDAHVAPVVGNDESGKTLVLHADYRGVSSVRTLESLVELPQYSGILGVRRLREQSV